MGQAGEPAGINFHNFVYNKYSTVDRSEHLSSLAAPYVRVSIRPDFISKR